MGSMLFLLFQIAGCAEMVGLPRAQEQDAIRSGKQAIVLIRVELELELVKAEGLFTRFGTNVIDGRLFGPNDDRLPEWTFTVGLGTFETAGNPNLSKDRLLSEATRRTGWRYFMLAPGSYYLSVKGRVSYVGHEKDREERWRMDVPAGSRAVYAGSIRFSGKGEILAFGDIRILSFNQVDAQVSDESELAARLLADYLPDVGPPTTIPLHRWQPGDTIILRAPVPGPTK